jgi:ABC-type uncharacterized transport system permease subunit
MMDFQKKKYIFWTSFVCLIFVLVFLVLIPLLNDINLKSKELVVAKNQAADLVEKSRVLLAWKNEYPNLEQGIKKIDSLYINADMPIDFLTFLEQNAEQSNLIVENTLLSSKKKAEGQIVYPQFKVSVMGPFPETLRFLEKMERAPYLIEIKSLSILRLSEEQLKKEKYQDLSPEDVEMNLLIQVAGFHENTD